MPPAQQAEDLQRTQLCCDGADRHASQRAQRSLISCAQAAADIMVLKTRYSPSMIPRCPHFTATVTQHQQHAYGADAGDAGDALLEELLHAVGPQRGVEHRQAGQPSCTSTAEAYMKLPYIVASAERDQTMLHTTAASSA